MIKSVENISVVKAEAHGEKVKTAIQGSYSDIVCLMVELLTQVPEALVGNNAGNQLSVLQGLYLTALNAIREKAK